MGTVNISKLKGKLTELGMNVSSLGEKMGYDKSSIYRRFKDGGASMSIADVNNIIKILGLSKEEAVSIFFSAFVA